jgi:hypothetical protein
MQSRSIGAALAVALVVTLGGVAGASTAQKSLPKKTYIKKADRICSKANQLITKAAQGALLDSVKQGRNPTSAELAKAVNDAAPTFKHEVASLKALPKPKGDAKKLKKIFNLVQKAYEKVLAKPARLLTGVPELDKAAKKAKAYGLQVCGTVP